MFDSSSTVEKVDLLLINMLQSKKKLLAQHFSDFGKIEMLILPRAMKSYKIY